MEGECSSLIGCPTALQYLSRPVFPPAPHPAGDPMGENIHRSRTFKFFIVASNLNKKLVAANYLAKLLDNGEKNYSIFRNFVGKCSSTLGCIMHKLGYCGDDERL